MSPTEIHDPSPSYIVTPPEISAYITVDTVCRGGPDTVSFFIFCFPHFYFPAFGQAVVTGVVPSPSRFVPSIFIAHRVQQSHCSSIFHRVLLTHALALFASKFMHKKKSQLIYTSMHSAGLERTKLAYTRLEKNLIRRREGHHRLKYVTPPLKYITPIPEI